MAQRLPCKQTGQSRYVLLALPDIAVRKITNFSGRPGLPRIPLHSPKEGSRAGGGAIPVAPQQLGLQCLMGDCRDTVMLGLWHLRPAQKLLLGKRLELKERRVKEPFVVMGTAGLQGLMHSNKRHRPVTHGLRRRLVRRVRLPIGHCAPLCFTPAQDPDLR